MKILFFLCLLFCAHTLYSQSINLFEIDTSDFPLMKAKFYSFGLDGNQTHPKLEHLSLTENNKERRITYVECPPNSEPELLSSVLVMDVSRSMEKNNLVIAKEAARAWLNTLPLPQSECAIISFDDYNYLNQDFTSDRDQLLTAISTLSAKEGTNYNAALLLPRYGGLRLSKKGIYKKVIVMLTDGASEQQVSSQLILTESQNQKCTVYVVTLGIRCPKSLKQVAEQTGGQWFENITTEEQATEIYKRILLTSQGTQPCDIFWESELSCKSGTIDVELHYDSLSVMSKAKYEAPVKTIVKLEFDPPTYRFQNPEIGEKIQKVLRVKAVNAPFAVKEIRSSNPSYTITPNNFRLHANQSQMLTLSYNATDSANTFSRLTFVNDVCEQVYIVTGGWQGKKNKDPTLRVVNPNGGQIFIAGNDTLVTWDGVSPDDTVSLEYSINNGISWQRITNTAYGLSYRWNNIPKPASEKCLVRVLQIDLRKNKDSKEISPPKIEWEKTFGGSRYDGAISALSGSDGSCIIIGTSASIDGDVTNSNGQNDFWIVKVDEENGTLIWQKIIDIDHTDHKYTFIESSDGNYLMRTFNEIIKINRDDGNIIWQQELKASINGYVNSIAECSDSTYIITGYTESAKVLGYHGGSDFWVAKLHDNDGSIIWEKAYGGGGDDIGYSIIPSYDNNFVIAGITYSNNGDVKGSWKNGDYWIIKVDGSNGNLLWQKVIGGSQEDTPCKLLQSSDSNYVVVGVTQSIDGYITNHKGNRDAWVVKLNHNNGNVLWQKTLGGKGDEAYLRYQCDITESKDGYYIVTTSTTSRDGDITSHRGVSDFWIVKINADNGNIVWQKTMGGSKEDRAGSHCMTANGDYILVGATWSNDGDITEYRDNADYWVVKLAEEVILQSDISDSVFAIVEPNIMAHNVDMLTCLIGANRDSVFADFIHNIGSWECDIDSVYIRGRDAYAFSILSDYFIQSIKPGKYHHTEFRFRPFRIGIHEAEIVIKTQTETLLYSISGIGVASQLKTASDNIDFGTVRVFTIKDTINVITIQNISDVPLTILNTKHSYPNDKDFTTIAGGGSFTLEPHAIHTMNLRFSPQYIGETNGTLEFYYDGVGSPLVIHLFGKGINQKPRLRTHYIPSNIIVCEDQRTQTIILRNEGGEDLVISALTLKENTSLDFSIVDTLPLMIPADSSYIVYINFHPQSVGDKSATIEIVSNSDTDSLALIDINGKKDFVSVSLVSEIDLGVLCPNEGKIVTFPLINTGTVKTVCKFIMDQDIVLQSDNVVLQTLEQKNIEVKFTGIDIEGDFTRTLSAIDSCGNKYSMAIKGKIVTPRLEIDDTELTSIIGKTQQTSVSIINRSDRNVTLMKIQGHQTPIIIEDAQFPLEIPAHSGKKIDVYYSPTDSMLTSQTIELISEPCSVIKGMQILGIPIVSKASLQSPNKSGYAGEEIAIPIQLISQENIAQSGITSIDIELSFNPTLLSPIGYAVEIINDTLGKISMKNIPIIAENGKTLHTIRCIVGLGNAEQCALGLSNLTLHGGTANINIVNGKFTLLGICEEGGTRLINPGKATSLMRIHPNPSKGIVSVDLELIEQGLTKVRIMDIQGNVMSERDLNDAIGSTTVIFDMEKYGAGVYYIEVRTPTIVRKEKIMIEK